jgi:phage terminase large subunit
MKLTVDVPRAFKPLLKQARYKGAWGGRGSGKSHFFAERLIVHCLANPGTRAVCIREVQKSLAQSVKQLLVDKIMAFGLGGLFQIVESEIRTPGDGLIIFQGMQNHTAVSIKSLEGYDIAWAEEAQSLSQRSLDLLRPTIRKANSEIWFSWNPDSEYDPVDRFLRTHAKPANAVVIEANYTDNPWLPKELLDEAELDKQDPDKFAHVWLGEYRKAHEGAYYAEQLRLARNEGRIADFSVDSLMPIKAAWDLGISKADSTAIWVAQWVGSKIVFLDYIEGYNQPLAFYLNELRLRGWGSAEIILPHDGAARDKITAIAYEDHVRAAGFNVTTIKNQGKAAAKQRIEVARRWFSRMWFDAVKCDPGLQALAHYHPILDEDRRIDLGPDHDWASHAADAFGLMATAYREPTTTTFRPPDRRKQLAGYV